MKLKTNIKNIHIPGLENKIAKERSMWQKGLLLVSDIALIVFILAVIYLFVRPLNQEVRTLIEDEVSSKNINFDAKTLDNLKSRQQPEKSVEPNVGKNPFIPF